MGVIDDLFKALDKIKKVIDSKDTDTIKLIKIKEIIKILE